MSNEPRLSACVAPGVKVTSSEVPKISKNWKQLSESLEYRFVLVNEAIMM